MAVGLMETVPFLLAANNSKQIKEIDAFEAVYLDKQIELSDGWIATQFVAISPNFNSENAPSGVCRVVTYRIAVTHPSFVTAPMFAGTQFVDGSKSVSLESNVRVGEPGRASSSGEPRFQCSVSVKPDIGLTWTDVQSADHIDVAISRVDIE